MLDLEDAVPFPQKMLARSMIKASIPLVAKCGGQVQVRINNESHMLKDDLEASVHAGVDCIVIPKVETAEEVKTFDAYISKLENDREIRSGSVKLGLVIESPKGILNLREIATISSRVLFLSLGAEDYCFSLGITPSRDGVELFHAISEVVTVAKAFDLIPIGVLGTITGITDMEGFEMAAQRARNIGFEGAPCIHPDQVEILNRIFAPPPEEVENSKKLISAFENAIEDGKGVIKVEGRMVDLAVYNRAKVIYERHQAIEELEIKKGS